MSTTEGIKVPSSVTDPDPDGTYECRFCHVRQPADREHFFPFRAVEGALHLRSRCRSCERSYRSAAQEMAKDGSRTIKPRGRRKPTEELIVVGDRSYVQVVKPPEPKPKSKTAAKLSEAEAKIAELERQLAEATAPKSRKRR